MALLKGKWQIVRIYKLVNDAGHRQEKSNVYTTLRLDAGYETTPRLIRK